MKRKLLMLLLGALTMFLLAACSGGSDDAGSDSDNGKPAAESWREKDPTEIEGEITVITQRTDIVDTVFQDYAKEFQKKYPNVKVSFEALTSYGSEIMPRMNTKDYGDVLLIPTEIPIADIPNYFEPLGSLEEMEKEYMGIEERAVDGTVYGIPIAMTYTGIIYNQAVFEEAGITELPKTQEDFLAALQKIKDNTDAIPLYTNYAAGWPLTQWEGAVTTTAGDVDYLNVKMLDDPTPFDPGDPHYEHYKLMYDVAKLGLIEEDPLTTDWESSKVMMNNGEIATMVFGSWALEQIQGAGPNADDIAIMPFPTDAEQTIFSLGADFNIAVNKNSKNKDAAMAWLFWFIEESGYAAEQGGGISAAKSVPLPDALKAAEEEGAVFLTLTPSPAEKQGLTDKIDKEAEVGLWLEDRKKVIIEAAIGNRDETYDEIMNSWNEDWKAAYEKIVGGN